MKHKYFQGEGFPKAIQKHIKTKEQLAWLLFFYSHLITHSELNNKMINITNGFTKVIAKIIVQLDHTINK
jgi:hypothetical protein